MTQQKTTIRITKETSSLLGILAAITGKEKEVIAEGIIRKAVERKLKRLGYEHPQQIAS